MALKTPAAVSTWPISVQIASWRLTMVETRILKAKALGRQDDGLQDLRRQLAGALAELERAKVAALAADARRA